MRRSLPEPRGPPVGVAAAVSYAVLTSVVAAASLVLAFGEGSGASFTGHLAEWWTTALLPPVLFAALLGGTGLAAFRLARDGRTALSVAAGAVGAYVAFGLAHVTLALAQDEPPGGDLGMLALAIVAVVPLAPALAFAAAAPALAARAASRPRRNAGFRPRP